MRCCIIPILAADTPAKFQKLSSDHGDGELFLLAGRPSVQRKGPIERVTTPRLTCSITSSAFYNAKRRHSKIGYRSPRSSRCRRD
jgi:hypothetical protein